ncbi:hypothetical protein [Arsenophonus endosymbiont of Aleurodicus floccissimus]|uniref:hypothetical protein n=1 Tax=Arsenophonus endosymbiont of Aleurodicus floccissimus TaxID=2152761 RepID=UPI0011C40690|nr:hypothetical protein [Arsenophonus endosymbiont of Aleurodicus floccissimus]
MLTHSENVCRGNGEFIENVRITSVMIMGAKNNRKLYIATNNDRDWIATKSYDSGNHPSDRVLIDVVVKANILNNYVDLCITGNGHELYGINLKI